MAKLTKESFIESLKEMSLLEIKDFNEKRIPALAETLDFTESE